MTGRTTQIAENLASGLKEMGVETKIANVKNTTLEEILNLSKESDAILVGSSTRYGDMIGSLEDVLKELIKLDLSNKLGAAFGSYGWSGEGIEIVNDYLKASSLRLVDRSYLIKAIGSDKVSFPLRIQFAPDDRTKELCYEAGQVLGELLVNAS
jgi:flavorubredoxin